jgi:cellobiose-specific phosphotransferase system component IIC
MFLQCWQKCATIKVTFGKGNKNNKMMIFAIGVFSGIIVSIVCDIIALKIMKRKHLTIVLPDDIFRS